MVTENDDEANKEKSKTPLSAISHAAIKQLLAAYYNIVALIISLTFGFDKQDTRRDSSNIKFVVVVVVVMMWIL